MKNREKYPKTEDALKAYEAHKKELKCDCTFGNWLDMDEDVASEFADRLAGLLAGAIILPKIFKDIKNAGEKAGKSSAASAPSDDKPAAKPSFCPFCGSRKLEITGAFAPLIVCEDCGAVYGNRKNHDLSILVDSFNRRADKPTD